ncbi:hypothetical protein IRT45_06035 [Nocardia sp. BSTN01]|uniref:DUF6301 family protein n=1 Tax=Nocardia sp. BSTN01 TaxID=2783665 RepID=UPI00188DD255|nr:DUF6301 family protein [Nocardia sp. BSTN01]MBF4996714.1 hypothetical protein [Nocardia sp. BSTN01]
MRIDLDRALAVVQAAIAFDWTWTTDDLPGFAHRVGWQVEGLDPPTITTNFDVNRTDAVAYLDHRPRPVGARSVHRICYYYTDVVLDDPSVKPQLDNAFNTIAPRIHELAGEILTETWSRNDTRMLRWDLPNLVVKLWVNDGAGDIDLVNPARQARDDEFDRMLESSEEDTG